MILVAFHTLDIQVLRNDKKTIKGLNQGHVSEIQEINGKKRKKSNNQNHCQTRHQKQPASAEVYLAMKRCIFLLEGVRIFSNVEV